MPRHYIDLKQRLNLLLQDKSKPHYYPIIEGFVENPHKKDGYDSFIRSTVQEFVIDTGASINILGRVFNRIFDEETPIVDYTLIRYGTGQATKLPIYKVNLKLIVDGGNAVLENILFAYDKQLETHVLGNFGFINDLEHFSISKKRRKLTFII
jgi:hypothetical protein